MSRVIDVCSWLLDVSLVIVVLLGWVVVMLIAWVLSMPSFLRFYAVSPMKEVR